jgi:hypothetical protein
MSEQDYYDIVAQEIQSRSLRPGLWARTVAETDDEGAKARALYIRLRVGELLEQEQAERAASLAATQREEKLKVEALAREKQAQREKEKLAAQKDREENLKSIGRATLYGLIVIFAIILLVGLLALLLSK